MNLSHSFYDDIPEFNRFNEVAETQHYRRAPSDWILVLTDIKNSTQAIAENRYKDVNLLGASTIVAVLNSLQGRRIPYVFGGDGATLLVHQDDLERVRSALLATQRLAKSAFGLELRCGAVPVSRLEAQGKTVEVAKFRVASQSVLAMIRGGGVQLAEHWIKDPSRKEDFHFAENSTSVEETASFEGLSCRWNPVPARKGEVISLLVHAIGSETESIYKEVLVGIDSILDSQSSRPLMADQLLDLKKKWSLKNLRSEIFLRGRAKSLLEVPRVTLKVLGSAFFVFGSLFLGLKYEKFDPQKYVADLASNTDFQKFDDMLRMIRDCEPAEREKLGRFLESLRLQGKIAYGMHVSNQALMTCLVFSLQDHIHFIDGDNGGYAMAAKQLKEQLAESPSRTMNATA